jgi:hypothetical protein
MPAVHAVLSMFSAQELAGLVLGVQDVHPEDIVPLLKVRGAHASSDHAPLSGVPGVKDPAQGSCLPALCIPRLAATGGGAHRDEEAWKTGSECEVRV